MPGPEPKFTFRLVTKSDLTMLRSWMEQPHWREWWGDLETEIGYVVDMLEGRDTTKPFIFQAEGLDVGYIQYWTVADQLVEPWLSEAPWMPMLPDDAIGVDLSIGDAKNLSQGLGSMALQYFVSALWEQGFRNIFIDPDIANTRAVCAYEKAGFQTMDALRGKTGDTLLMQFDPRAARDRRLAS